MRLPAYVGYTIPEYLDFSERVKGYARYILAHPHQNIHFIVDTAPSKSFISEAHRPL